jgi:hypothetical protein
MTPDEFAQVKNACSTALNNLERFTCHACDPSGTISDCIFTVREKAVCQFPFAYLFTENPVKYEYRPKVQDIPIAELLECPLMEAARQHQQHIDSGGRITER